MRCGENNLGEALGLRPGAAVVADDGGGAEVLAFDLAQEVVVDVRLPRHPAPRSSSCSGDDFASSAGGPAWFARGVSVGRLDWGLGVLGNISVAWFGRRQAVEWNPTFPPLLLFFNFHFYFPFPFPFYLFYLNVL